MNDILAPILLTQPQKEIMSHPIMYDAELQLNDSEFQLF